MSGWMADMADAVDAAEAGTTAPPATKAAPPRFTMARPLMTHRRNRDFSTDGRFSSQRMSSGTSTSYR